MATLLLDRAGLEVRSDADALMLYEKGVRSATVPLALIDRLIIQGAGTRLDAGLLQRLAERGATVLLLSPRHSRRVALVLGPAHNDAAIRLAQGRRVLDEAFCQRWAAELVAAKLRRQYRLLERLEARRPQARKALFDARGTLAGIAVQLNDRQPTERLRGLEGSAARAYFGGLAATFAPALGFCGRNRRPPRDPVNAGLSLAYTLLHVEAVRAAHIAGLDPLLGFYHRPAFGRESLACDLIEPLRPAADEWLWTAFADERLREDHFSRDRGACLLGKAGRARFYAAWEASAEAPRRWLRRRCARLAAHLRDEGLPWLEDDDEADTP